MNTKKLTVMALLMVAALPLTQTAFARDRGDDDNRGHARPAPAWHRDDDRRGDRTDHRDWRHDHYRYHHDNHGYYPRRDWDNRRVTVVLPTPPLLLPPPVLLVPQLHDGRIVLRPAF
jgi:hypothetical protein